MAAQPVFNCGCFGIAPGQPAGNVVLSVDNPFLTADQRAIILDNIENNPLSDRNINCTLTGDPDFCGYNRPEQDYF